MGRCAFILVWLVLAVAARGQDVVFSQAPDRLGGYSSDTELYGLSGDPTSQLVSDDFLLAQDTSVCAVNWWAFFGGDDTAPGNIYPPATETLRVRFYGDAAGLPGGVLAEQTFVDPSRVATGHFVSIGPHRPEYLYSVALSPCFAAAANTTYWLEVAQIGDLESNYRWETSLQGGPIAFQHPIGAPWRASSSQLYGQAFELRRAPEPSPATFLLLTCPVVALRRRWRAVKKR